MQKPKKSKRSTTRRAAAAYFMQQEASEGSDEEDDQGYGGEAEINDEETNKLLKDYDERKRKQRQAKIHDVNVIDQHVKDAEKYATYLDGKEVVQVESHQLSGSLKRTMLPSISDPALWLVKCKPTREQWCAASMMNKFVTLR